MHKEGNMNRSQEKDLGLTAKGYHSGGHHWNRKSTGPRDIALSVIIFSAGLLPSQHSGLTGHMVAIVLPKFFL